MFVKYNSIENSYREKFIDHAWQECENELRSQIFFVSDKIDGSNLGITYIFDEDKVEFQSRNQIVEDNFMGMNEIAPDLEKGIRLLVEKYKDIYSRPLFGYNSKVKQMTIFGELFGRGIQKKINYGPNKYFRFFDVLTILEDGTHIWAWQDLLKDFENEHLKQVPVYFSGPFKECLEYDVENQVTPLSVKGEITEGVVIKPQRTVFTKIGSRFILKKKTKAFSEISKPKVKKNQVDLSVSDQVAQYINVNRLETVFSKIEPKFENFADILVEFQKDIITELDKDGVTEYDTKAINNECKTLIREELKTRN